MSANPPIIIAIDGPAASGKGTIARALAAHFDFAYLDTGSLYRAAAFYVLEAGSEPSDVAAAVAGCKKINMAALNTEPLKTAIRSRAVSAAAAAIAQLPEVRAAILSAQRDFAAAPPNNKAGAILDGRDIGTTICPDAAAKLYITATPEIRAQRRLAEFQALPKKGVNSSESLDYPSILEEIIARDTRDSNRAASPLKRAADAHLLDSSDLSIEEAILAARHLVEADLRAANLIT